ncbi:MAG: cupin domain-containing protein [Dehalococcoidales bacterium]|nr:cupin domain-containing protein [Dehalococcoidales bacterium]
MRVSRISEVEKAPFGSSIFTSRDVTIQSIFPESEEYEVHNVNFGRGTRLKFHSHDSEQILIVTAGRGIVATEQEEVTVTPGDVAFIPAGEKHWHGAAGDSEFSHIFIYRRGCQYTQLED